MPLIERRALLRGLFAMPAIVAASSLMPIRGVIVPAPDPIHLTWEAVFRYEYDAVRRTIRIIGLSDGPDAVKLALIPR